MNSYRTEETPAGGFESITIDNTAGGVGFTAATITVAQSGGFHKRATRAFVTVETAQLRFTYDGTAPTASAGHIADPGDTITIVGEQNVSNFKAIRTGATSATIRVTYHFNR